MIEKTLVVGPFQCNCRILVCQTTGDALVVDPGDDASNILTSLKEIKTPSGLAISVKYLLHTHGHLDHIAATREVKEARSADAPKTVLHRADDELYMKLRMQSQLFQLDYGDPAPIDHYVEDGEELRIGKMRISIIHTPGHSPGSICFRVHEDLAEETQETLYSGDTLFRESVGRTDLWGGNQTQMFKSIRNRILILDAAGK